jgi:voltage-gated potassium channel
MAGRDVHTRVNFPQDAAPPLASIVQRVGVALSLVLFVALVAYLGRDGYEDAAGDGVSLLDALYYATVSITTTGYGDVRPESSSARLVTTLLVTPARVLFLIILVGTTLEVLAERTRISYRVNRWRAGLHDHVIVCGYGTKGRSAARAMLERGRRHDELVVIDGSEAARADATADGIVAISGDATRREVLEEAGAAQAAAVVVAPHRDDAALLITLTVRQLNPTAAVIVAARESENVALLRQGGATSVIESASAAGRLLGLATQTPRLADILEDQLSVGQGLDIMEREAEPSEVGPLTALATVHPVIAIVREGRVVRFDQPAAAEVRAGDHLVFLCAADDGASAP